MLCRRLRIRPWRGIPLALVACFALIGGIAILPITWSEEETPSLTPTTHTVPLTAVAESTGVRIEKLAQSHRPLITKLDRHARVAAAIRAPNLRRLSAPSQIWVTLPGRHPYAPRSQPSSPDDPSHSPLS